MGRTRRALDEEKCTQKIRETMWFDSADEGTFRR